MLIIPESVFNLLGMSCSHQLLTKHQFDYFWQYYINVCDVSQTPSTFGCCLGIPSCTAQGASKVHIIVGELEGFVRQIFKAINGVDSAVQVWNKHFHSLWKMRVLFERQDLEIHACMCTQLIRFKVRFMLTIS